MNSIELRECWADCGRIVPATDGYFYRSKGRLMRQCKRCVVERAAKNYQAHKANRNRTRRQRTCEGCRKRFVGAYRRQCDECVAKRIAWDELRVFRAKARSLRGDAVTRAKRSRVSVSLTHKQITKLCAVTACCPICDRKLNYQNRGSGFSPDSPSLDRFVPELGYVADNVSVICVRCNVLKRDATVEELEAIVRWMKARNR